MNELLSDLYELSGAYFPAPDDGEARSCRRLRERHLGTVRARLGEDFTQKLRDVELELERAEQEAAFLQGLRLGLSLCRL